MKHNVLLTGGHAGTTALAVIEEIQKKHDWKIYWVGPKHAVEGKRNLTLEFKLFPDYNVTCLPIRAGRIQRKFTKHTIPALVRIPVGIVQAFGLVMRVKPKVILSFGGFAGFPVVVAGFLLGIPVVVHEQTVAVGLANKHSARFARKITLARAESAKYFPKDKVVVVGNPMLSQVRSVTPKTAIGAPPQLFITCGSRGSQIINRALAPIIPTLLAEYEITHQTGDLDIEEFLSIKKALPLNLQKKYHPTAFYEPTSIGTYYSKADIIIARAGANTVSEVIYVKRPTLFIPIPWSRYNEQTKNAEFARDLGIARVIHQNDLAPDVIQKEVEYLKSHWKKMVQEMKTPPIKDESAAASVVDIMDTWL